MTGRLCLINPFGPLAREFERAGWEVLVLNPPPGAVMDLPRALDKAGFPPDLFIQRENMTGAVLLAGLESLDCPKLFWAMDPHLNLFWHAHYARLFDLVLSTQAHLLDSFARAGARAAWVPWFAPERDWTPWKDRTTHLGFVGRVTEDRPGRTFMVARLKEQFGLVQVQDINPGEMLAFYDRTRLAPNESILAEVNFRLFETAGCGCLPLTQDLGEAQEELFAPGREMETYANVLELEALIGHYQKHPEAAEAMGRAAWERANKDHLAAHRVRSILDLAAKTTSRAAQGSEARLAWTLARVNLHLSGKGRFNPQAMETELSQLLPNPKAMAALISLSMYQGDRNKAEALVAALLADPDTPPDPDLFLAGSTAAMELKGLDWARIVYARYAQGAAREPKPVNDRTSLLLAWAELMAREGIVMRTGFPFHTDRHLPATAYECLLTALEHSGRDRYTCRRMDALLASIPGMDQIRLNVLSHLSLHDRKDWRLALNLGLVNLRAFRAQEGLEELRLARNLAREQGVEPRFHRALAARDPKGLAARVVLE